MKHQYEIQTSEESDLSQRVDENTTNGDDSGMESPNYTTHIF